jgi:hypothetical protein
MTGEWSFWSLCVKLGLLVGLYRILAKLISYILESRSFCGSYCHLDDGNTYEEKGFTLKYTGWQGRIWYPRSGSVLNKDGSAKKPVPPKDGSAPKEARWYSDLMRNRVEIYWGDCAIAVTRIALGVYEGYYMQGPNNESSSKKVRIQKIVSFNIRKEKQGGNDNH